VDLNCVEMAGYCDCCGNWVWPNGEPEDWDETWEPVPCAAAEDFIS
jgi:hypothetical protein